MLRLPEVKVMERLRRTLRLAKLRNDRLAIAVLESRIAAEWRKVSESEMRAMWGDR